MERRERTSLAKARMDLLADFFDGSGTPSLTKRDGDDRGSGARGNRNGNPFADEAPFVGRNTGDAHHDPFLDPLYRSGDSTGAGREAGRVQVHSRGDPFGFQVEGT